MKPAPKALNEGPQIASIFASGFMRSTVLKLIPLSKVGSQILSRLFISLFAKAFNVNLYASLKP